jgi:hypothetical protein
MIFFVRFYAGDHPPPFSWRLWFNYKLKYHYEKYENNLTLGYEHYHFPLTVKRPNNNNGVH